MRGATTDEFRAAGVSERVAAYDISADAVVDLARSQDELVERAATLLLVMPPNQRRSTIEWLLSPDNPERGRRAIDALIESALVLEDEAGLLHRVS